MKGNGHKPDQLDVNRTVALLLNAPQEQRHAVLAEVLALQIAPVVLGSVVATQDTAQETVRIITAPDDAFCDEYDYASQFAVNQVALAFDAVAAVLAASGLPRALVRAIVKASRQTLNFALFSVDEQVKEQMQ